MRIRVKICGITRPEDGRQAAEFGADAIGLVFCARSPRNVDIAAAERIIDALPPLVSVVALFLNPRAADVERVLAALPVDLLQFHGLEPPEFCRRFGRRYLKALSMDAGSDGPRQQIGQYPDAAGFLLDAHPAGELGGRGEAFDWSRIPPDLTKPFLLAGGLNPDNVAAAVRGCRPYGVDVSSGVEAAKGVKDAARMAAFINEVRRVESD